MHEDDAALHAALAQVVLADLRAGRSSLSPPAVAALRILAAAPGTPRPDELATAHTGRPIRRAGIGVGIAALAAGVFLVGAGSDSPRTQPESAPAATRPSALPPIPTTRSSTGEEPAPVAPVSADPSTSAPVPARAGIPAGSSARRASRPVAPPPVGGSASAAAPTVAAAAAASTPQPPPAGAHCPGAGC